MDFDENQFFREATKRICGSLDIETAAKQGLLFLKDFIPADGIHVARFDPELGALRVYASIRLDGGKRLSEILPMPPEAWPRFEWPEDELIRISNQPETSAITQTIARALGKQDCSQLIMHVRRVGEKPYSLGSFALWANGRDRYSKEHARLLSLLNEPVAIAMSNCLKHQEILKLKEMLSDDYQYLHREFLRVSGDEIVGGDFGLRGVMDMVRKVAPLDSPVLLLGETGVGKEVVANVIHTISRRRTEPYIKVNCGAIPEYLVDSELFGHERGAFTGAISRKRGRFERAHGGTILLDEIGELTLSAQVRLLRVLQHKEIERVGGTKFVPVDIRTIAATHQNLEAMVLSKRFREDLFYRLNVFPILIPPLRERKGDIPALVHHFINRKSKDMGLHHPLELAPGSLDQLMDYDWPGNVRELENMVERALIKCMDGRLVFENMAFPFQKDEVSIKPNKDDKIQKLDEVMSIYIRRILKIAKGKINGSGGAAELLGVHPNTLRKRMIRLGIPYGRRR